MTTHPICTLVVAALLVPTLAAAQDEHAVPTRHNEATVAQLQAEMASGRLSSEELTREYLTRIFALDQDGPGVNSVIELNPDALAMARKADALRRSGVVLGPLHGIPVLLKDNIDTGDKMQTSAGSFALVGTPALRDSTVAANLRAGGAVILGKTNLSEWANFRSSFSISGWSGRGGQTHNPYGIDRNPCGSSAGSAAAASANFAAVSFGSETDGSIVCPGNANGVAAIKGGFLLAEIRGPDWRVRQFNMDGVFVRTVPLPSTGIGISAIASTEDSTTALIGYSGWSVPPRWVKYDAESGGVTTVFEVKPAGDYSQVHTWRLDALSTGGVRVPITVMALGDPRRDGERPTILSAYGFQGRARQPAFNGSVLAWLERGGVLAWANIRGGGEYGEGWHADGSRANKQHCFDDLHAAARALIDARWTDVAHLGIFGRSAGGELMGAALTQ